ncbi:glycosyltransferase [Streptococcus uberis]|uniref:glycosyltransferase family 2 protein n=1 Tax=Streptococcus uberis TaxID=1349 RepID=UPI0027DBFB61|nr:glycosyltransferase [Streptococcus uberis]MCK1239988.1 glycosyltransferase [Streptococcus uberis]
MNNYYEDNSPLVSVIIPTYKREVKFISRAIMSVIQQSYENIQLIVVDDSPSNFVHRNEIKKFVTSLNNYNITFIQNEKNLGGSLARNVGIAEAKGKYTTFLDDDDEYEVDKIKNQVKFMESNECDLSFSDLIMYNNDGKIVDYREFSDIPSFDNDSLLRYHLQKHMTGTPTFIFKTLKLKEIGGFEDSKMGQEFYLMLKSIEKGLKIAYNPICDVKVYKHEEGGIAQGQNKINGEIELFNFKKTYFQNLSKNEQKYINFRHWAVMVVAYKRNKMYFKMIVSGFKAFFASPTIFLKEVFGFVEKIVSLRHAKENL